MITESLIRDHNVFSNARHSFVVLDASPVKKRFRESRWRGPRIQTVAAFGHLEGHAWTNHRLAILAKAK
jgi:hypothetical protein